MRRVVRIASLAVAVLLLAAAVPAQARWEGHGGHGGGWHGHGGGWHDGGHYQTRVFLGLGPVFWPPYYGGYAYGPPVYYGPPRVIVTPPPVYIQPAPPVPGYWYYCPSARAYYPQVQRCPEPWVPVPPEPE